MNLKPDYIFGDMHLGDRGMFARTYSKTFETQEQYQQELISRWNKIVTEENKIIFLLGDLGQKNDIQKVIPQLRGQKYLIMGNHDTYAKSFYSQIFVEIFDAPVFVGRRCVLSHHPIPVEPGVVNIHGHTHDVFLASDLHFNACPEHHEYKPLNIKKLELKLLGTLPKPNRKFLHEWYAEIQTSPPRDDLIFKKGNLIDAKATLEKRYREWLETQSKLDKTE